MDGLHIRHEAHHEADRAPEPPPERQHELHSPRSSHWGLRGTLLFPPHVYPMAIFINLILRLTWSFKLSSHLHIHGAVVIFWIEVAELLRRWMWVFFRVEWECVKKMVGSAEFELSEEAIETVHRHSKEPFTTDYLHDEHTLLTFVLSYIM